MIKKICNNNSLKIRRCLSSVFFLIILAQIFIWVTYLFRNPNMPDRARIVGIKEEQQLDVINIGSSDAFTSWQPMKAWNDYGIASYSYSTNSMPPESIMYYMKEVLKTQQPKLFIVSVRSFPFWDGVMNEGGIRRGTDCMDLSWNRLGLADYYLSNCLDRGGADELSFYIDVIKYHTNYDALKEPENWELINNSKVCPNKGWEWMQGHRVVVAAPTDFKTNEKATLPDGCKNVLYDLLHYCIKEKIDVLFTVSPYAISLEDQMKYNTMQEMIEQYGYQFLNANEYYGDIGIDFSNDFTDVNHVNCFGAEKYTDFLEKYIKEHYHIPDHREDMAYQNWNEEFISFSEEERRTKDAICNQIVKKKEGIELGSVLSETTDIWEWSSLLNNPNYTIICAENGCFEIKGLLSGEILQNIGLSEEMLLGKEREFIGIIKDAEFLYSNMKNDEEYYQGTIGDSGNGCNAELKIAAEGSIMVDGFEYGKQQEGLNVVIFDHNYNHVVDSAVLAYDDLGELELIR